MKARTLLLAWVVCGLSVWLARAEVQWNGLYHNNTNLNPQTEMVPMGQDQLLGGPHFLEVDEGGGNVTVYFLTDHPACTGPVACRVRFFSDKEEYRDAYWMTNVVLSSAYSFHGTPPGDSLTVEIWKAEWQPSAGFTGTVYYAPQVLDQGQPSDIQSLVRTVGEHAGQSGWGDNGFFWKEQPQAIGNENTYQVDYSFRWSNAPAFKFDWGVPEAEQAQP